MKPGDRFTVTEDREIRNKKGRLLARYKAGFNYSVTTHNLEMVNAMEGSGVASSYSGPTGRTNQALASPAKVKGRAKTGKGK